MMKSILNLLEIQEIDLKILQLAELQKTLPENLSNLKKDVALKKQELDNATLTLRDAKAKQKNIETELESHKTTILKYKTQLYQIKSNEQYKALLNEIDGLEKKSAQTEDLILGMMMQIDEKEAFVKDCEKALKKSEENLRLGEDEIKKDIQQVDKEIQELRDKRNTLKKDIEPQLFKKYERILKNKHGTAIVPIIGNVCQGCFMKLPPNDVNEVRRCDVAHTCDNCARILYLPPEN